MKSETNRRFLWFWPAAVTCLFASLLIWAIAARRHVHLWPGDKNWSPYAYADDRGSTAQQFQESQVIRAVIVISPDHDRFAGVGFAQKGKPPVDISGTSDVRIRYRTRASAPLLIQLRLELPGYTRQGAFNTERGLFAYLAPANHWTEARIPLSEFKTPVWWYQINGIQLPDPDPPEFSRFLGLNVCASEFTPTGEAQQIDIQELTLEGSWAPAWWSAALLPVPWLFFLVWRFKTNRREQLSPFGIPLEVTSQDEAEFARVVQCIAARYADPDLSLPLVSRETGIHESKISSLLEPGTGLRFKPYLNRVRIDEAARLLMESDRTITEIAFMVGYSNTTHFNRVFRSLKGIAPSEYRRTRPDIQHNKNS